MGYRANCTKCSWAGSEFYPTETTARVEGQKHEREEHDGESCTEIEERSPAV